MPSTKPPPQTLFFDIFGTTVSWLPTVSHYLHTACQSRLSSPHLPPSIPASDLSAARAMTLDDWRAFTLEWRRSYLVFTSTFDSSSSAKQPFMDIDTHHHLSLRVLLAKWSLLHLFSPPSSSSSPSNSSSSPSLPFSSPPEPSSSPSSAPSSSTDATLDATLALSRIWHRLPPHPDMPPGLKMLREMGIRTSTLSNGNTSLLRDLVEFGKLDFAEVVSAEDFGAYKPDEKVYRGGMARLGVGPGVGTGKGEGKGKGGGEVAMVASHLGDLKAARGAGMQTVYLQREGEEAWSEEDVRAARDEGWVDWWIGDGDGKGEGKGEEGGGLVELVRRFKGQI